MLAAALELAAKEIEEGRSEENDCPRCGWPNETVDDVQGQAARLTAYRCALAAGTGVLMSATAKQVEEGAHAMLAAERAPRAKEGS